MTDPISDSERKGETSSEPPGLPRWVKISAVVVVVLALALILAMALVGGEHGPGLHTGGSAGTVPSPAVGSQ